MTLDELLVQFVDLVADRVAARLNGHAASAAMTPDRWLTAAQVAKLLATSERWVYDHQDDLGGKRLSRRCLRFSEAAVQHHLERRR